MSSCRVISSDNHIVEPVDLWTSRAGSKLEGRVPHVESLEEGDWWFCDGQKLMDIGVSGQAGGRFEEPETLTREIRFEEVRPGGYLPEEHIKDMDLDGIDIGIVYPTVDLLLSTEWGQVYALRICWGKSSPN